MPKTIWNEGRVVGYSAYEIFVKQHLAENPDIPVPSEREWLASSIQMGSSMLLYITPTGEAQEPVPSRSVRYEGDDNYWYMDYPLPSDSILAAPTTIIGSFFDGDAYFDGGIQEQEPVPSRSVRSLYPANWATRVTDYGDLIANDLVLHPNEGTVKSSDIDSIPTKDLQGFSDFRKAQLRSYMNIIDGIVIQPGDWKRSNNTPPAMDLEPSLMGDDSYPVVRLYFRGPIVQAFYLLLSGFTIRTVLSGISGLEGSTEGTPSPQNGDFLGPQIFPWANKIIFSVPNSYIQYFVQSNYRRQHPADATALLNRDSYVIDMKSNSESSLIGESSIDIIDSTVLENFYTGTKDGFTSLNNATLGCISKLYQGSTSSDVSNKLKSSRTSDFVSEYNNLGDGSAVLTIYQRKSVYPPALYGTFVNSMGDQYLHPIDIVAPGSVKMFHGADGTLMQDYQVTFPGTTAINLSDDGILEVYQGSTKITTADVTTKPLDSSDDTSPLAMEVTAGKHKGLAVSLQKTNGTLLPLDGTKPLNLGNSYKLNWRTLLNGLRNNKYIAISDVLRLIKNPRNDRSIIINPVENESTNDLTELQLSFNKETIVGGPGIEVTYNGDKIEIASTALSTNYVTLQSNRRTRFQNGWKGVSPLPDANNNVYTIVNWDGSTIQGNRSGNYSAFVLRLTDSAEFNPDIGNAYAVIPTIRVNLGSLYEITDVGSLPRTVTIEISGNTSAYDADGRFVTNSVIGSDGLNPSRFLFRHGAQVGRPEKRVQLLHAATEAHMNTQDEYYHPDNDTKHTYMDLLQEEIVSRSILFAVRFGAGLGYLNYQDHGDWLYDTIIDNSSPEVWNVNVSGETEALSPYGSHASFIVNYGVNVNPLLNYVTVLEDHPEFPYLIVYAGTIADGYNNEYSIYDNASLGDNCKSSNINISIKCTCVLNESRARRWMNSNTYSRNWQVTNEQIKAANND